MKLNALKTIVCKGNVDLVAHGLVVETWGNLSAVDRDKGVVVIKPSGVSYERMRPADMVVVSLETGERVGGHWAPSCDLPTHLELYRAFRGIGAVVHTHSLYATAWAQAGRSLPALGTTHADVFYGAVPCTRPLRPKEIAKDYEVNTGRVIVETMRGTDPLYMPGVLVAEHGPFSWGRDVAHVVSNAVTLEQVARMALETVALNPRVRGLRRVLLDKHFLRKHGPGAYYGQKRS